MCVPLYAAHCQCSVPCLHHHRTHTAVSCAKVRTQAHAAQDYILPVEYVNTMRDYMLDKCPVSTYRDIAQVIQEDLGKSPGELFASIEEVPIASASLAQVMIVQILSSAYAVSGCFDRTMYFRSCQYSLHIDQVEMVSALQ